MPTLNEAAEVLRLRAALKEWCDLASHLGLSTGGHRDRTHRLLDADPGSLVAAVEGLVKALEPFERFAARLDSPPNWVPDGCPINTDSGGVSDFSVGQLRDVRAALAAYRAAIKGEVSNG